VQILSSGYLSTYLPTPRGAFDMKQVTYTQNNGKVRVKEVPVPALRPDGVLVRTAFSLISAGTDRAKVELSKKTFVGKAVARPEQTRQVLQVVQQQGIGAAYRKVMNRLTALQPLGYSCAGTVIAVGAGADEFHVGDLVACAGAGYASHAEVNFVPVNLCVRVPKTRSRSQEQVGHEGVALDEAAFATVGAIALQGVRQADVRLGECVAVVGLGLIGLLTVQLLKASGCRVIGMDLDASRCARALSLGCDFAADSADKTMSVTAALPPGQGVDAAILTASTNSDEPVRLAAQLCRNKARVVVVGDVGMNLPREPFYMKELDLRLSRSYGPGRYDPEYEEHGHDYPIGYVRWTEKRNVEAFLELIAEGSINVRSLITHRFGVDEADRAYDLIAGPAREPYLGVVVEFHHSRKDGAAILAASDAADNQERSEVQRAPAIWLKPEDAASTRPVRLGILGAGNFAHDFLLPNLREDDYVELRGVCTASGLSARSTAEKFGFAYCTSDPRDIFADSHTNAVVIASRHDTHAALVSTAVLHRKHIFVEKPLCLTVEELRHIDQVYCQAAREDGTRPLLMVGFNRRFAPLMTELKEFFAPISEPLMILCRVNAGFVPRTHWVQDASQGGRIVGEVCHYVDLAHHLVGFAIVKVAAETLPNGNHYCNDNVVVTLTFANGSVATVAYTATGDKSVPKERIEVFGGGTVGILDDFRSLVLTRSGRKRHIKSRFSQDKGHLGELQQFVSAVMNQGPPPIPVNEIFGSMLATLEIVNSLRSGVPIPIHDGTC